MSSASTALTDLVLETFRLNGALLTAGDDMIADLGLTSARWQVLGAVDLSSTALPVAHIARNMGLSRQAVQRLVNEMALQALVRLMPNPHHQRAKLVEMTPKGRAIFDAAMERQRPWADKLAIGLSSDEIRTALRVLQNLRSKLQLRNDFEPAETENVEELA